MARVESHFAGKHVLVTGGSMGIGLATARRLVDLGAGVTLVARGPERLAAALVDDVQTGSRIVRRLLRRRRSTVNVVSGCGDAGAERTLVVLAHHDAHQAGRFYDQGLQQAIHRLAPDLLARLKTSPPQWWLGLVGPLLTVAGGLSACVRRTNCHGGSFAKIGGKRR